MSKDNPQIGDMTNRIANAAKLLPLTVEYHWKRRRDGWHLVTVDGHEMRRTSYCPYPRKLGAMTEMARIFGAEVYRDVVFVNGRTAFRHGFQWSDGSRMANLTALENAMPND